MLLLLQPLGCNVSVEGMCAEHFFSRWQLFKTMLTFAAGAFFFRAAAALRRLTAYAISD